MNTCITAALREQFDRTWAMWRAEIGNIPAAEWRRGEIDYLIPVRHACHVLETVDFYTGELPADHFPWGQRYDGDWEGSPAASLPDRPALLALLDDVTELFDARLAALTDEELCAPAPTFPWAGGSRLSCLLYLLRHTQHHLGELHAELRRRGLPRAEWK